MMDKGLKEEREKEVEGERRGRKNEAELTTLTKTAFHMPQSRRQC